MSPTTTISVNFRVACQPCAAYHVRATSTWKYLLNGVQCTVLLDFPNWPTESFLERSECPDNSYCVGPNRDEWALLLSAGYTDLSLLYYPEKKLHIILYSYYRYTYSRSGIVCTCVPVYCLLLASSTTTTTSTSFCKFHNHIQASYASRTRRARNSVTQPFSVSHLSQS